jgi:hypothetical protein
MEIEDLLTCLGQSELDQRLIGILQEIGIDLPNELSLPEGEYRAYIERPNEGYSLVFTDEAMFLGKGNQAIGKGALYLSGIFLYAEGKDGYLQFEGELPMKLSFSNMREDIIEELGKATWNRARADGSIAAERWDTAADFRIHITYSKSTSKPVLISLNIADKQ